MLSDTYCWLGRGSYGGHVPRVLVCCNLFLVFWLGPLVGSLDVRSPDCDPRFFKENLDELPGDLITEVQKRITRYIVWLAEHLMV